MGSFGNFLGGFSLVRQLASVRSCSAHRNRAMQHDRILKSILDGAVETGKDVARRREEELWADFNVRVKSKADVYGASYDPETCSYTHRCVEHRHHSLEHLTDRARGTDTHIISLWWCGRLIPRVCVVTCAL